MARDELELGVAEPSVAETEGRELGPGGEGMSSWDGTGRGQGEEEVKREKQQDWDDGGAAGERASVSVKEWTSATLGPLPDHQTGAGRG